MYLIFHKKMSFSEERQRLECGDDDMPVIDYIHYVHTSTLDEHLADEVVLDVHYVPKQSNNKNKIKRFIKRLKPIKSRHSRFIKCLHYIPKP